MAGRNPDTTLRGVGLSRALCVHWARRYELDVPDPFLAYRERVAALAAAGAIGLHRASEDS
ncbi:MAG: hypothetical protein MJE12_03720 [Alphaproteobacteria bacterium]|nr:hypothetical protein [Alphaproteobacteria bacterium]